MPKTLKKLTMSMLTADATATPASKPAVTRSTALPKSIRKPLAATNTDSPRIPARLREPAQPAAVAKPARTERDPNSLLSNNFRLFRYVGSTRYKGQVKLWFANELEVRTRNMALIGHTEIFHTELPQPMTKADALTWLQNNASPIPAEAWRSRLPRATRLAVAPAATEPAEVTNPAVKAADPATDTETIDTPQA